MSTRPINSPRWERPRAGHTMPYHLKISKKRGYLHAKVTGKNSKENVRLYLQQLIQECETAECRYLLIEERLEGPRLDATSVFDIVSEGSMKSRAFLRAIAYVDVYTEGPSMKNAESFATNRGLNVQLFSKVGEAKKWLVGQV